MADVSYLTFTNTETNTPERRDIKDATARASIEELRQEVATGGTGATEAELESIRINQEQHNNVYEGRNLLEVFGSEIAQYANVWEYLRDRVDLRESTGRAEAYKGLNIGDYAPLTIGSNTYNQRIGAFDYDQGCCDTEQGPSLLMVPDKLFPDKVKWNNANDNNGTAAQNAPYLASNIHSYLQNTLLPQYPSEVRAVMKTRRTLVEKRYSGSGKLTASTTWGWEDIGRIWLLSENEVYGCIHWGDRYSDGIGTQIALFRDPRNRIMRNPDGERYPWWLRSVSGSPSTDACRVYEIGNANYYHTSYAWGVGPGFLIG